MGKQAEALNLQPVPLETAKKLADHIVDRLYVNGHVSRIIVAGSIRRRCAMTTDIDIQAIPKPNGDPAGYLTSHPKVTKVLRSGGDITSVVWKEGGIEMVVDLYLTTDEAWFAHLMFLTGSGKLNIRHRAAAKRKGFKLSQHGLFGADGERIPLSSERQAYAILNFTWHDPWDRSEG